MQVFQAYNNYLERLELEEEGQTSPNHFSCFNHLPRHPFTVDQFFNFIKGTEYDPENWTVEQLEEFYFVPIPKPFTVPLYLRNLVAYRTLRK